MEKKGGGGERAVQFKCNTGAKSVTPVQKA